VTPKAALLSPGALTEIQAASARCEMHLKVHAGTRTKCYMASSWRLVCCLHQKLLKNATKDGLANLQWPAVGQCEAQQSSDFIFKWLEFVICSETPV